MITMSELTLIKNIGLQYAKATFSDVGDNLVHNLDVAGFSPHLYNRRHIVTNGGFKIDWMVGGTVLGLYNMHESTDSLTNMLVYPFKHQPSDAIMLTALEPNSAYYCILTLLDSKTITDEQYDLTANQTFTLKRGRLYVCNVDLTVNGTVNSALKPFACVYNEVSITPSVDCKLASFYTV